MKKFPPVKVRMKERFPILGVVISVVVLIMLDVFWVKTASQYVASSRLEPYTLQIMNGMSGIEADLNALETQYLQYYFTGDSTILQSALKNLNKLKEEVLAIQIVARDKDQSARLDSLQRLLGSQSLLAVKHPIHAKHRSEIFNPSSATEIKELDKISETLTRFHIHEQTLLKNRLSIFKRSFRKAIVFSVLVLLTNLILLIILGRYLMHEAKRRRLTREILVRRKENFKGILENLPSAVVLSQKKSGEIVYVNRAFKKHFGIEIPEEARWVMDQMNIIRRKNAEDSSEPSEYSWKTVDNEQHSFLHTGILAQIMNEHFYLDDFIDITQRKIYERELDSSQVKLQEALEARDRFMSILSHDIRSPLSSVIGFSQMLIEETHHPYAVSIHETASTLLHLLNNLLQWSRMKSGTMPLTIEKMHFRGLVQQVFSVYLSQANEKGVKLSNLVTPDTSLSGDKNMLETVFRNLVSNALRFTPAEGQITVSARQYPDKIVIQVRDNGQGIPEEKLPYLFTLQKYKQKESNSANGLGLLLCYEIIKKHQGEITVKSQPGRGTVFTIILPQ